MSRHRHRAPRDGVLPFRYPKDARDRDRAGLCEECLDSPIVQTPCPHGTLAIVPIPDMHSARPADNSPSENGGCSVCGCWLDEHQAAGIEFDHPYEPTARRARR